MSYILDALKKADADRERDTAAVPDLHAQVDAVGSLPAAHPSRGMLLALAAGAVALAVLAWRWLDESPPDVAPPMPMAQVPTEAQSPSAPAPAPVAAMSPRAPPPDATVPALAPVVAPDPAPIPSLASKPAPPRRRSAREVAAAPAVVATPPTPGVAGRPSSPASAATEARIYSLAELPPDIRGRLPALTVGGSVYSPQAASRIVILNGRVFREGDKPVDGLLVERIGLKSTVLAFRGVRFEIKH